MFRRQVEEVPEPIVSDVPSRLPLDHHRPLIVPGYPGPQQIELRFAAGLEREAGLFERRVRLLVRRFGMTDRNADTACIESIRQRGVEVRLV